MTTLIGSGIERDRLVSSRQYCAGLTRREAKNFYYGLKLLPEPKRSAMYALYAYMRLVDDIADDDGPGHTRQQRLADLQAWRRQTAAVLGGDVDAIKRHPLWPAFADMAAQYHVPERLYDDMIDGQRQDLDPVVVRSFEQLHTYCYRVASVVGLASIYVWGFTGGKGTEELAIKRGIAFQLTNILRDLKEDAGRGRVYVPADELKAAGLTLEELLAWRVPEKCDAFIRGQLERAEKYYADSAELDERVSVDSRPTLNAMTAIYHGLLEKISADPRRITRHRVALSLPAKMLIGWRALRSRSAP